MSVLAFFLLVLALGALGALLGWWVVTRSTKQSITSCSVFTKKDKGQPINMGYGGSYWIKRVDSPTSVTITDREPLATKARRRFKR